MRTRIIPAVVIAALAGSVAVGAFAADDNGRGHGKGEAKRAEKRENRALFAAMNGRKEVSATGERRVGDPDGRGSFTAIVDGDQLCYGLTVKNIDAPSAAHIHRGQPDEAGPVVVPLASIPASGDPGASSACATVDVNLLAAILKNPHRYYVNVHNAAFPGGAVRAQLSRHG